MSDAAMKNYRPNLKLVWAGRPPVRRARRDNHLYSAHARLDDDKALTDLLEPLPQSMRATVRAGVKPGECGRFLGYDQARHAGIIVVTDGKTVGCYVVTDVTVKQAATVAAACDDIERWSDSAFQEQVVRALGGSVQRVQ